jgi:hypothetical protein
MAMLDEDIRVPRNLFTSEDASAGHRIHGFRGKHQCPTEAPHPWTPSRHFGYDSDR